MFKKLQFCPRCKEKLSEDSYAKSRWGIPGSPCRVCDNQRRNSVKDFRITNFEFKSLLEKQQYKCLGCRTQIGEHDDLGINAACIDHDHKTGKVRGLLCRNCNLALGNTKDNKATLRRLMAYLSYDRTKINIYLIGALKNKEIPYLAENLKKEGFDVFAEWHNPGPEADMFWQEHEKIKGSSYKEALNGLHVENIFYYDLTYLDFCDAAILVMPAGKSGHLELGYAAGSGKKTFILLDNEPERYDIMPKFANAVCNNYEELIEELRNKFK